MELEHKDDWPRVCERYEAWWQGEMLDRPLVQVTAPKEPLELEEVPSDQQGLLDWFTDPDRVISRLERQVADTYWGGDAFPVAFPVSPRLVAIEAAYLGCPYRLTPTTAWVDAIIEDWGKCPSLDVDSGNVWWHLSQQLLEMTAKRGIGRYCVGIPDLEGGGQIVAMLRGTERLAKDLIDHPQMVKAAVERVNAAWLYYYSACYEIIHRWMGGYVDCTGVWSESSAATLECDFSCMISPKMFKEFFLPSIEQQTQWIDHTIYHLDGPGALRHLDALLDLPELDGIEWVPGPVTPHMTDWIPLLQRIQAARKLLVINCKNWEVKTLLTELKPEGILLKTCCQSVAEAEALVEEVECMFGTASDKRNLAQVLRLR